MINSNLLDILVCPVSKDPLQYDEYSNELVCHSSGLAYPMRGPIPVLLESAARKIETPQE